MNDNILEAINKNYPNHNITVSETSEMDQSAFTPFRRIFINGNESRIKYNVEAIHDLSAMHNIDASGEYISIITGEIDIVILNKEIQRFELDRRNIESYTEILGHEPSEHVLMVMDHFTPTPIDIAMYRVNKENE